MLHECPPIKAGLDNLSPDDELRCYSSSKSKQFNYNEYSSDFDNIARKYRIAIGTSAFPL